MPFYPFWGEGSPTKSDCRKKDTLILTSLLEDLEGVSMRIGEAFRNIAANSPNKSSTKASSWPQAVTQWFLVLAPGTSCSGRLPLIGILDWWFGDLNSCFLSMVDEKPPP